MKFSAEDKVQVDRLVLQAERAKLCDAYEKRLKKIARIANRISGRDTMRSADIDDLCAIIELANSSKRRSSRTLGKGRGRRLSPSRRLRLSRCSLIG